MLLFFLTTKAPLLTPPPAVRTGLVSTFANPLPDLRITFQCNCTSEEGYLYFIFIEETHKPPDSCAATVLIHRLCAEVTVLRTHCVINLRQPIISVISGWF